MEQTGEPGLFGGREDAKVARSTAQAALNLKFASKIFFKNRCSNKAIRILDSE